MQLYYIINLIQHMIDRLRMFDDETDSNLT